MSDIISARCFGCGHTIKVPAGLGGKKARCPQCTNTITIPNPSDTQAEDIVSDADLPQVAVNETYEPEEGDAPNTDAPLPSTDEHPTENRRRNAGTAARRSSGQTSTSHQRIQRSGTQPRYTGPAGPSKPSPAAGSNQGMIIGIALGVVALLIIGFVVAGKSNSNKNVAPKQGGREKEKERETGGTKNAPQYSPEDQALVARALEYAATVNRGEAAQVMRFYTYDPEEERRTRLRATEIVEAKTTYDNPQITAVSSSGGTTTFSYGGGKTKSLQWKLIDGLWMIAEKPSP